MFPDGVINKQPTDAKQVEKMAEIMNKNCIADENTPCPTPMTDCNMCQAQALWEAGGRIGTELPSEKDIIENERITYLEGEHVDEAVLYNARVHLECLTDSTFMLIIDNERHWWHFIIHSRSGRANVDTLLYEDNSPQAQLDHNNKEIGR